MGFVLTPEEALALIEKDPRNRDVLFPYLNGEDLNSRPDQSPSRWVINFHNWPLERAETYPDCMRIVREKVKPERDRVNQRNAREKWWLHERARPELYATIVGMERVLVRARVSEHHVLTFVAPGTVMSEATVVFAYSSIQAFGCIQSNVHECWARVYSSSLETRMRYAPSDCFDTFPFPTTTSRLEEVGERYLLWRQQTVLSRDEGLTLVYNRFHSPDERAPDTQRLRDLHVEMDRAVANAYGWTDLELAHGFHQTKQGLRFTIREDARREILGRLLTLNHECYEKEVRQGLHAKGIDGSAKKRSGKRRVWNGGSRSLFDERALLSVRSRETRGGV